MRGRCESILFSVGENSLSGMITDITDAAARIKTNSAIVAVQSFSFVFLLIYTP